MTGSYKAPYTSEHKHLVFDFQIIIQTAKKDLRPTIPEGCPEVIKNLLTICWDKDPEVRLSCPQLAEKFKEAEKEYKEHKLEWDQKVAAVS